MKLIKLRPHVVSKIWGGKNLINMKNLEHRNHGEEIGETWEVSLLKEGSTLCEDGTELAKRLGEDSFKYLVKFIDTSDNLSVQVHPDNEYAKKYESSLGKTECWFILDAQRGSGIYLGLKKGIDKVKLEHGLRAQEDISDLLNFIPVKEGDFFYVPAGTIHAIGKGVTLAEVQQSSGVTYRVWDWNRVDVNGESRELHVDKALDVINFRAEENDLSYFQAKNFSKSKGRQNLIEHEDFKLDYYNLDCGNKASLIRSKTDRPASFLNLKGTVKLNDELINPYEAVVATEEGELRVESVSNEDLGSSAFLYIY